MRKHYLWMSLTGSLFVATCGYWTAMSAEDTTTAKNPSSPAESVSGRLQDNGDDDFIVHEWGTFTTFSGSNGVFLDFRPLAGPVSDLPDFVLDRASLSSNSRFSKRRIRGRVRMETPVTYFYTDKIRDVRVSVDFPEGLLTEFYPPVKEMLPKFDANAAYKEGEPIGDSRLDWGNVTLIPIKALVPDITDPTLRDQVANHISQAVLPTGPNNQHYGQARQTDSALVHVRGTDQAVVGSQPPTQSFLEKFLFYRGVGNFELPFKTVFDAEGRIEMRNDGELPMNSAILIKVDGDQIAASTIDQVGAKGSRHFAPAKNVTLDELSRIVSKALVAEGLYEKEALSMVETWKQSWFTEQGTRVLYMVPGQMTDELLPLNVQPRPKEMLRVLVGRMEVMSPDVEQRLLEVVKHSIGVRAAFIERIKDVKDNKETFAIPKSIREFGRLAEPALVRAAMITRDTQVRSEAEFLLAQLRRE